MDWETDVAAMQVEDAVKAITQEQKDMRNAEKVGLTTRKPEKTMEEMLNAIRDSMSDLASSDAEEDGVDEKDDAEDTELAKLNEDDEPGWVMGTISKMAQHCMESGRQMQMKLRGLTQPWRGDATNNFPERDMKYRIAEWMVLAVVQLETDDDVAASAPTTFG